MKITALLPMKGHSERVPNKNMRLFANKPLYHCIASILERSEYIDKIIINTDSLVIAEDAKQNFSKVEIVERPASICGDMIPMNDIIGYDLNFSDSEYFLQTHSTNPLIGQETLNAAIENYFEKLNEYDSLFSVNELHTRMYWQDGKPVNHDPAELLRTQDLPPLYEENSCIYIFSKQSFHDADKKRIGNTPQMFPTSKLQSLDIDEEEDFLLAELVYLSKNRRI